MIGRRVRIALLAATLSAPAAALERHLLVISGLGGEPEYADHFHRWSATLVEAAIGRIGLPPGNVTWLSEDPARDPQRIRERTGASSIAAALERIAQRSQPGDVVMIVLIGHGTAQPGRALFNIPGPDLSAEALARQLDALAGRTVVVVNTSSASGAFLQALSAPGRVVATATASGAENQHTRFAAHFVDAWAGDTADADKDGRVSVLEAFDYARGEVARDFQRERRLLTEHAVLDDDGNGVGTRAPGLDPGPDPGPQAADGQLARTVHLASGALERAAGDPRRQRLEAAARELVAQVEAHRRRKAGLSQEEYEAGLETLLVDLALNRRALGAEAAR